MTIGRFKVDIYGFTVEVVVLPNPDAVTEYRASLYNKYHSSHVNNHSAAFVFSHDFKCWIVFGETDLSYDIIGHEIDHLRACILNFNNIYEGSDNENSALLAGHLTGKVFSLLLSKGYTIIDTYNGKNQRKRNSPRDREIRKEDKRIPDILRTE